MGKSSVCHLAPGGEEDGKNEGAGGEDGQVGVPRLWCGAEGISVSKSVERPKGEKGGSLGVGRQERYLIESRRAKTGKGRGRKVAGPHLKAQPRRHAGRGDVRSDGADEEYEAESPVKLTLYITAEVRGQSGSKGSPPNRKGERCAPARADRLPGHSL